MGASPARSCDSIDSCIVCSPAVISSLASATLPGIAVFGSEVQAALLGCGILPPPSPSPDIFTGLDGPRTRRAPDAGIAPIVQRVVRDVVLPDIGPDLLLRPIGQRV